MTSTRVSATTTTATTRRHAALVFNPAAGRAREDLEALRAGLEPHFELAVYETCRDRDADVCARRALELGADLVIAAGGDGTVSLVAGAMVGSEAALGIVARGTSNSIATGLGIPTDLEGAMRTLVEGEAHPVDTARANGRAMILHASVGFHAAAVGYTPRQAKNRWGMLAYIKEGLAQIADFEPFQVELETDDEIVRCRATNVTVANVAPLKTVLAQGPASLSPADGALDVTIVAATGLAEAVVTGLHLLRTAAQGEPATRDNVGFLTARRLHVRTDPPQPLLIDGEKAGEGAAVSIECLPASVKVVLPATALEELGGASGPPTPDEREPEQEKLAGLPGLQIEPKP